MDRSRQINCTMRRVEHAMSKNPISRGVEAPVEDLIDLMERHGIKRILILVRRGYRESCESSAGPNSGAIRGKVISILSYLAADQAQIVSVNDGL